MDSLGRDWRKREGGIWSRRHQILASFPSSTSYWPSPSIQTLGSSIHSTRWMQKLTKKLQLIKSESNVGRLCQTAVWQLAVDQIYRPSFIISRAIIFNQTLWKFCWTTWHTVTQQPLIQTLGNFNSFTCFNGKKTTWIVKLKQVDFSGFRQCKYFKGNPCPWNPLVPYFFLEKYLSSNLPSHLGQSDSGKLSWTKPNKEFRPLGVLVRLQSSWEL